MTEPKKPPVSVNVASMAAGSTLLRWGLDNVTERQEDGFTAAEALDLTRRAYLTALSCLSLHQGIDDAEIATFVEAFGARIRSGEAAANAKAWGAEWKAADEARKAALAEKAKANRGATPEEIHEAAADLTRLAEALDDASRRRQVGLTPTKRWYRVVTGLTLPDGGGVTVYAKRLDPDTVRVTDIGAAEDWLATCNDGRITPEMLAALAAAYGLALPDTGSGAPPAVGAVVAYGVSVPWSGVAAAVDRVASFQVAVGGLAHGAMP